MNAEEAPPIQVAVVEDDVEMQTLLTEIFEERGWPTTLLSASDVFQLLTQVRELRPDIIVLDIVLGASFSGWKVLEMLKHDEDTRAIPVIVCSGSADIEAKQPWLLAHGINVVSKPFSLDRLYASVEGAVTHGYEDPLHSAEM